MQAKYPDFSNYVLYRKPFKHDNNYNIKIKKTRNLFRVNFTPLTSPFDIYDNSTTSINRTSLNTFVKSYTYSNPMESLYACILCLLDA